MIRAAGCRLFIPFVLAVLMLAPAVAGAMPLAVDKQVKFKVMLNGGEPSDVALVRSKLEEPNGFYDTLARGGTHWLQFLDKNGGPVQYEQVRPGTDACADFQNGVTTVDPILGASWAQRDGYDVVLSIAVGDTCTFQAEGGAGGAAVLTDRNFPQFNVSAVHEVGHAIDLPHANSWRCPSSPGTAPWSVTCVPVEYGSLFDVMGFGQGTDHDQISELTVLASNPEYMPENRGVEIRSSQTITLSRAQTSGHGAAVVPTMLADTGSPHLSRGTFPGNADEDVVYRNVFAQGIGFEPASYDADNDGTPDYGIGIRALPFPVDLPTRSGGGGTNRPTFLFENQHAAGGPKPFRQLFLPGDTFTVPAFNFAPYVAPVWGNEEPVGGPDVEGDSTMTVTVVSADPSGAVVSVSMDPLPARTEQPMASTPASAPTDVQVSGVGGLAGATWIAPAGGGITTYDVDWTVDGLPQPPRRVSATAVSLGGVVPGASVRVSVRASNGAGIGAAGTATGIIAGDGSDAVAPAAPVAGAVDLLDDSLVVHWAPSADGDVAGYRIRLNGDVTRSVPASATSAPLLKLRGGTPYVVTVTAIDAAGNASTPTTFNATTTGFYTAPVRNIQLEVVGDTVVATWDRGLLGNEPTSYQLRWSAHIGGVSRDWPVRSVSSASATFDPGQTLTPWDTIFVQINAVGPGGRGHGKAGTIQVPDPALPETPDVTVNAPGSTTVALSWPRIDYHGVPTNTEITGAGPTKLVGTNSVGLTGLTPETPYTVTLVAIALQNGNRSLPRTVTFTTGAAPGPTGTALLQSPIGGDVHTSQRPLFFWSPAAYASTYTVKLDGATVATDLHGEVWFPNVDIAQGQHSWEVIAHGPNGDTTSVMQTFAVDLAVDSAPTITSPISGAALPDGYPTVTFAGATDSVSGIDHYELHVDGQGMGRVNAAARSINPYTTISDGTHTFTIVAFDVAGHSLASAPVVVTVGSQHSVEPRPDVAQPVDTTPAPVAPTPPTKTTPVATPPKSITGGAKADKLIGNALANLINGGGGNDTVNGGAGNDTVRGGTGNDKVIGGVGKDKLFGDAGNDTLDGADRAKGDVLDGGPGKDTCIYNKGDVLKNCEKKILKK